MSGAGAPSLALCPHCGQPHPEDVLVCPKEHKQLPLEGRLLDGKFRFAKLLGAGGMGAVWKAHNVRVKKSVAIKLMHPEFAGNPGILDRFRQEATAAGEIGNQHICDIYDFGPSVLGPYIVLEMLNGRSLGELITQYGRVDPGLAAIVLRQALEGLEAAHRVGIVHRDLKPENIFLHEPSPGRLLVKLMDFGISKFSQGDGAGKTSAGVLMGTPEYMSPEQSEGAASVDARTDIWAMGAILYKALTGAEAFAGASMAATLVAVATKEPRPIHEFAPNCPPELVAVVATCLKKDPGARYSTARELSDALAPFEQMAGALPPPPNPATTGGYATAAPLSPQTSGPQPVAPQSGGTLITRGNPNTAPPPPATMITGGGGHVQGPGPGPGGFNPQPNHQAGTFVGGNFGAAGQQDDSWSIGQNPNTHAPSTLSGTPTSPGGGNSKIVVITIVLLLVAAGVVVAILMRTPKDNTDKQKKLDEIAAKTTPETTTPTPPDPTGAVTPPDPTTAGATTTPPDATAGTPDPTGATPDPTAGETAGEVKDPKDPKKPGETKTPAPKPVKIDTTLVFKDGDSGLYTLKNPGSSTIKNQKDALAVCAGHRKKKTANLTGWTLASAAEAAKFKPYGEVNKRTFWTRDPVVAGRVTQYQMLGGRILDRDPNDPRAAGSALCVARS